MIDKEGLSLPTETVLDGFYWILLAELIRAQQIRSIPINSLLELAQHTSLFNQLIPEFYQLLLQTNSTDALPVLLDAANRTLNAAENQPTPKLVMVAGHQGVGKGIVISALAERDYTVMTMSHIIRKITAAFQLDPNDALEKMRTATTFKRIFGRAILAELGLIDMKSRNILQIAMDGPRKIEEAQFALRNQGVLIGVIADPDPEKDRTIRYQRIRHRATIDPQRLSDVANFNQREHREGRGISKILELIPDDRIIINNGDPQHLLEQVNQKLQELGI